MPDTIPQHYATEFSTNWIHRVQQTKARLDEFVEDEAFNGERKRYDRLAAQNSRQRTERKGPTNITDPGNDSRWVFRRSFDIGNLLDKDDALNLAPIVLPTSDYVRSHTAAYLRDADDVAWQAALGAAMTGEFGTNSTPLPALTQWIGKGGRIGENGGTASGLTVDKLIKANRVLQDADLEDGAPRVLVCTAVEIENLLSSTKVTSADYNTVKALVNGTIDTFMGFKFRIIKRLPRGDGGPETTATGTGNIRRCVAWVKGAIKRTKGSMTSDISIRKDLSMATQIYSAWNLGAVRVYDEGVVQIDCDESVAVVS